MVRISEFRQAVRAVGLWEFTRRVLREVNQDNLLTWASALAYSWLFAFFPFLLFLLTLVPHLPMSIRSKASEVVHSSLDALPQTAADLVWDNIQTATSKASHALGWSLFATIAVTVWAASGGMSTTMSALDRCYELSKVGRSAIKRRVIAFALTAVVASLILLVMILLPVGTLVTDWIQREYPGFFSTGLLWVWNIARYSLALLLLVTILAVIYYFGTSIRQPFRIITPGGTFCIAVWIILGLLFRFYVNHFGRYDATYGSLAGVAILLLFFYIDSLVLLMGAEINSEVAFANGIPRGSLDHRMDRPRPHTGTDETTDFEPTMPFEPQKPD